MMTGTEQFIASLVNSLAWPAAVAVVAVTFRRQIGALLSSSLKRLKAGPVEFEFDRVIASAEANLGLEAGTAATAETRQFSAVGDLAPIAQASPTAAVLEAHSRLEHELRQLTNDVRTEGDRPQGAVGLARLALEHGLITPETESAIVGVTTLRNLTAHGRQADVSVERAMDYLALVDGALYALRQGRGKRESS
jgi:hypothetical protein